jgi:hypothetical protein
MRGAAALLLILLGGCGERSIIGEDRGVTAEQITNLSSPRIVVVDRSASMRLRPLIVGDVGSEGSTAPMCDFGRDGRLMLRATASGAFARIGGRLRHLVASGPINDTGGFFESGALAISVGRRDDAAGARPPQGGAGTWPARLIVTNRRPRQRSGQGNAARSEQDKAERSQLDGVWRCAA